ncbi:alpha/beta fold hydrolase [Caenispirillum bisanense]|uniref:Putative redox protein n=1 Tax=Caenispirillum bisanense TaxID=414052 RepID=A0A286H2P3_9PROT|nr:alpha/beta fold hydrolase [Caenispirillum bisanense]SOE01599.1 putative redox protein [Caenispirillum bisanense]
MTASEKVTFHSADGHTLAARLERPDGEATAWALFAHCFTCSKDVFAASRVAKALAERGIGTLRFDFTGLGDSEGEFGNAGFSSNVADVRAAVAWMAEEGRPVSLLVGHSLGGAAVLAAAPGLESVSAVVTLNAPCGPAHVTHLFTDELDAIHETGKAEVKIAGRSFTITRDFLEDIDEHRLLDGLGHMHKALLVMHAPRDEIVGIDNATRIFAAARHPRSFISLDDADHLLSDRADAAYAAEVIAAWAGRYLPEHPAATAVGREPVDVGTVLVEETGQGRFQQRVTVGGHEFLSDEPVTVGGMDSGPSPYDLLLASLGTCTAMTIRLYAARKQIPLTGVAVRLHHEKRHVTDCEHCDEAGAKIDHIDRRITLSGDLDDATRAKLLEIADKCPVHRTLHSEVRIATELVD